MELDLDRGIARLPKVIVVLGLVGTGVAGRVGGLPYAWAFMVGAGAAYFNFRLIERFVDRLLGPLAAAENAKPPKASALRIFFRFTLLVLGAFVILRLSGFNVVVALCGFFVCPAAVMLEIFYELLTSYGHS